MSSRSSSLMTLTEFGWRVIAEAERLHPSLRIDRLAIDFDPVGHPVRVTWGFGIDGSKVNLHRSVSKIEYDKAGSVPSFIKLVGASIAEGAKQHA